MTPDTDASLSVGDASVVDEAADGGEGLADGPASTTGDGPTTTESASDQPVGTSPFPDIAVTDIRTGQPVDLAGFLPSDKPLVVWFWAPHCPACNREAPDVAAFAAEHAAEFDIVGLGTQDDLAFARRFVEQHSPPFTMLWDESFESWRELGVRAQPAAQLFDADGTHLGTWSGSVDQDGILAALAAR
ncbi:MAG: TlpA family protein disulfide reductase [Acidimicrobiia bacterium]|nr:TlpA family protein disulfide reductase [Acidimicrobiia bacterium]